MKKILKLCFNTSEWSPNRSEWLRLLSSLPKSERDRIGTFAYKRDSKNSLAGQILLRMCIKRLVPRLDWPNIVIERNQKGRPCLKLKESLHLCNITDFGPRVIDLNVTHAGDLCAVVAAIRPSACGGGACSKSNGESCWLGVDCMKIEVDEKAKEATGATSAECDLFDRQISKYEKVIRSRFSQAEKDYVYNRVNSAEKLAAFYRLWCLKESYAKATGLGISGGGIDPSKLEFQIAAELMIDPAKKTRFLVDNSKLVVNGKPKKECKFYEQYWVPNANRFDLHIIAVCLIDADDSDKLGKWEALGDEFVEISAKDMFDEFSKSNPPCTFDEAKSKEFDEQWTNFNKKL